MVSTWNALYTFFSQFVLLLLPLSLSLFFIIIIFFSSKSNMVRFSKKEKKVAVLADGLGKKLACNDTRFHPHLQSPINDHRRLSRCLRWRLSPFCVPNHDDFLSGSEYALCGDARATPSMVAVVSTYCDCTPKFLGCYQDDRTLFDG